MRIPVSLRKRLLGRRTRDSRCQCGARLRVLRFLRRPRARESIRHASGASRAVTSVCLRITPRAAAIVNAHRLVDFDFAVHRFRRSERDLAKRNAEFRMQFAGDVNFARVRQSARRTAIIFDRICNRIHRIRPPVFFSFFILFILLILSDNKKTMRGKSHGQASLPSAALPASGSRGSIDVSRRSSQPGGSPALNSQSE